MTFSYSLKPIKSNNSDTYKKNQIKGLNNFIGKTLIKRKNISAKENFYQYLFVQNLFKNVDSNVTNVIKPSKISVDSTRLKGSSFLSKNDLTISSNSATLFYSNSHLLNKNSVNYTKKLFINYKKPFLCYWVLPFLGLASCFPTLFPSVSLPINNNKITPNQVYSLEKSNGFYSDNDILRKNSIDSNSLNSLISLDSSKKQSKNEYYLSFYTTNFKTNHSKEMNKLSYQNSLQFLLFSKLNGDINLKSQSNLTPYLLETNLKTQENKKVYDFNKSLSDFSFALLNRNLKKRSNFKWFWFDLFLNKNINTLAAFPNKLYLQENDFILEKSTFNKKRNNLLINEKKSNTNSIDYISKVSNFKNNLNFFNVKNQETKKTLIDNIKQGYDLKAKKDKLESYLIGIRTENPFVDTKKILKINVNNGMHHDRVNATAITPYKSLKKALFLMDQVLSTTNKSSMLMSHLNSGSRLKDLKMSYIVEQNKTNLQSTSNLFNGLQKTVIFILKNKNTNKTINKVLHRSPEQIKNSTYQKVDNLKFAIRASHNIVYNCIFEGLKKDLNQIILSKAQETLDISNNSNYLNSAYIAKKRLLNFQNCSLNLNALKLDNNTFGDTVLPNMQIDLTNSNESKIHMNSYPMCNVLELEKSTMHMDHTKLLFTDNLMNLFNLQKEGSFSNLYNNFSILKLRNSIRGGNVFEKEYDHYLNNIGGLKNKSINPVSLKESSHFNFKEAIFTVTKKQNTSQPFSKNISVYNSQPIVQKKLNNNFSNRNVMYDSIKPNSNSYAFLSKYIQLIKTNIKSYLSPYKYHLKYLPELDVTNLSHQSVKGYSKNKVDSFSRLKPLTTSNLKKSVGFDYTISNNTKLIRIQNKNQNFSFKFEKMFLSYLSKSKKPWNFKKNSLGFNNNESKFVTDSFLVLPKDKLITFKNFKRNIKTKLKNIKPDSNFSRPYFIFSTKLSKTRKLNKNILRSPLMLMKHRLFINKEINQLSLSRSQPLIKLTNEPNKFNATDIWVTEAEKGGVLQGRIKKQHLKLKRRLKKMKKETRRRKKRKIFYPRPTWITFSMYKKFLDARYSKKSLKNNDKKMLPSKMGTNDIVKKSYYYSYWLNKKRYSNFNNDEAIFKNTKDFYRISSTVFRDLKRVLMKSNWLRSYLNPYLEKVKTIYKEMQQSSKNMQFYINVRAFILSIYGYFKEAVFNQNTESLKLSEPVSLSIYLNMKNALWEHTRNFEQSRLVEKDNSLLKDSIFKTHFWNLKRNSKLSEFEVNTKRQNAINQLEYNRIVYQRIQRVILNIRENVNLNGQIKNRSKKLGKNIKSLIKRDYTKRDPNNGTTPNQKGPNWSKLIKNNIQKLSTYFNDGYDASLPYSAQILSRNNLYWTLNKSAAINSTNFYSSRKNLWETNKIRETSKGNKTKKILFNLFMKYNILSKPINSLDGYSHILDKLRNEKLAKSLNVIPADKSLLNLNNINQDFSESKISFTLPAKNYSMKSEQKLITIENKLKLLGLYSKSAEKYYKNGYFRFLKQQLLTEKNYYQNYNSSQFKLKEKRELQNILTNSNNNYFYNRNDYTKMSNDYSYWWSSSKIEPNFYSGVKGDIQVIKAMKGKQNALSDINFNHLVPFTLSSFLFHFCALISFISLGGIRTLIKFYYILISKVSKLISQVQNIRLFPKKTTNRFDLSKPIELEVNQFEKYYTEQKTGVVNPLNSIKQKYEKASKIKRSLLSMAIGHSRSYNGITNQLENATSQKTESVPLNLVNTGWIVIKNKNSRYFITNHLNNQTINNNAVLQSKTLNKKLNTSLLDGYKSIIKDFNISLIKQINKNTALDLKYNKNATTVSLNKTKIKTMYYSLLKLSIVSALTHKTSFYAYLLLLKSVDILAIPASFIYKFFEKPGEYVVENLAYSFLVEWSADLITTIPDTVDINTYSYFNKINTRSILPIIFTNMAMTLVRTERLSLLSQNTNASLNLVEKNNYIFSVLLGISNSVLKRFLNSSFLLFIQQLSEPDLDYINRQKKGLIFWDIWGESLKKVAEENSINIYELTTDKEEQIKLLSKYEESFIKNDNSNNLGNFSNNQLNLLKFNNASKFSLDMDSLNSKTNSNVQSSNSISTLANFREKLFNSKGFMLNSTKNNGLFNNFNNILENSKLDNYVEQARSKYQNNNSYGWAVSQFLSYQGKDTDLFIDLHPPKTFSASVASLKYSLSVQQPIGSIVCQIFAGIFYKKVSKNILVVGSSGLEKSLLIQAIAGETELKIITDNAHRYAMVYRGVAVGIKLLRDVFEALTVHTPCIFLMEDIHAIGERRPFLIDEASSNASESTYNKNQSMQGLFLKEKSSASREGLYRSNKHLLSHYKKPYKEPKGLATNHFSFSFLFGDLSTKPRNNDIKPGGAALPIQVIKKENQQNESVPKTEKSNINKKVYSSSLLIKSSNDEFLSPPESSPFNVLILKEAAKLKHKKIVKEMPWFGLPGEQYSLVSKYNYSIRVKVALLADLVLSNLSVKLDMITDLLVIIDSVKGNRGFVVFATTHVPYILDPALRRPGRFDETISLPLIPTLYSRWANYRYNVQYLTTSLFRKYSIPFNYTFNKGTTLNLSKYDLINSYKETYVPRPIENIINYIYVKNSNLNKRTNSSNNFAFKNLLSQSSINSNKNLMVNNNRTWKHLTPSLRNDLLNTQNINRRHLNSLRAEYYVDSANPHFSVNSTLKYALSLKNYRERKNTSFFNSLSKLDTKSNKRISNKQILKIKSKNYSYACKALISLMLYMTPNMFENSLLDQKVSSLKWPNMLKDLSNSTLQDYSVYLSLFGYPFMLKIILMSLMGGKLGEHFVISSNVKRNETNQVGVVNNTSLLFNFDEIWKYSSSLLFSYIQKRQCSTINKSVAMCSLKLLSFNNKQALMEAPSPPISNILLPAKRYENYKRTFNNQYSIHPNNFGSGISQQIQYHQQQRLLKRLYKYPIKEFFKSEIINSNTISNFTTFNNSYLVLTPLEKTKLTNLNKVSSLNACYRNILYNRHKTYLINQWWNGQQGEHNAETTFLSDIDWRYTFVQSIGDIHIDFPDAEQFYNPRNRRWMLTQGDWTNGFNLQTEQKEIYSHYVYECFTTAYKFLDRNREIIDFYAEFLHQAPLTDDLKERDLLNLYKRFLYGFKQMN